jgi:hypothetical protein
MVSSNFFVQNDLTGSGISNMATPTITTQVSFESEYRFPVRKIETKKERIKRIATEKMLASWKTFNEKTKTIIKIKQVCKPKHKLSHMGRKNFKC